jgi:hypothetical protein
MPELLPASGVFVGGLISNKTEFAAVNTALAAASTALGTTATSLASTTLQMASLATGMAGLAVTTTAVTLKINTSLRGPAIGVKSTDANFSYNVNVNVLTARNALAGPTDQIPIPPPPVGL